MDSHGTYSQRLQLQVETELMGGTKDVTVESEPGEWPAFKAVIASEWTFVTPFRGS